MELRTDIDICNAIKRGGSDRRQAIEVIYNWNELKEKVNGYIIRHGGTRGDGLDIFHDAIVILDRSIRQDKFRAESSLQGYLFSICRFTWNNAWRKRLKTSSGDVQEHQLDADHETPEIALIGLDRRALLQQVLELLDDRCIEILRLWKLSYSMDEIARSTGLSSPAMAKKYRYRCMNRLLDKLKGRQDLLNALKYV